MCVTSCLLIGSATGSFSANCLMVFICHLSLLRKIEGEKEKAHFSLRILFMCLYIIYGASLKKCLIGALSKK